MSNQPSDAPRSPESQQSESQQSETQQSETQQSETQQSETQQSETQQSETQQSESQRESVSDQTQAMHEDQDSAGQQRRRILIGSQRDPAAYLAKPRQSRAPVVVPDERPPKRRRRSSDARQGRREDEPESRPSDPQAEAEGPSAVRSESAADQQPHAESPLAAPPASTPPDAPASEAAQAPPSGAATEQVEATERIAVPNLREALSEDLEAELNSALAEGSMDALISEGDVAAAGGGFEPDSKRTGRVVAIRREDVFIELGSREQGIASLRQFAEPPELGAAVEVIVRSFNQDEGFYELTIPGQAEDVADWSDLQEGMVLSARITGHNAGGLECEVNHIPGFIPISQVSLYRVEGLEQFVGEQWTCLVTEANPERRNLVLSRRGILEREREEARQRILQSLQPGQVFEGVVRKLLDFGAFVDLGEGVDGLLHISQLSWGRVEHPRDVLSEGQRIKVKIEKVDPESQKISLAYRDLFESPWTDAEKRYPEHSTVRGTVTKLMEFGAFVELEPGVEGLVHISELAHKRIWRASDVVSEGQEVEVLVLSVDSEAQRISLSMKQLTQPEPVKPNGEEAEAGEPEPQKSHRMRPNQPLKGGLGRGSGGAGFGLKW